MDRRVRLDREGSERESCLLGEDMYPESSQVCAPSMCMICEDGKWVELESEPEE